MCVYAHPAAAALSFIIGTQTSVGSIRFSSAPDSVIITGGLTGPGAVTTGLDIPANRIQYDIINSDQGAMASWTIHYSPAVGPNIIGAYAPVGYITSGGADVPLGGYAYTTLFNPGAYGIYTYNTGSPWIIDYEVDHITFTATPVGLPANDGIGELNPAPYLPSFAVLFNPNLANGLVPASATIGTATFNGQVYGPLPGNNCISIEGATNIVVQTCSNCAPVTFTPQAEDTCCPNVNLQCVPPSGSCFPVGVTTVTAWAFDNCGNFVTNYFTVTVVPGTNCVPGPCITIEASNIVVYTCNPCTPVVYNAKATDNCCAGSGPPTLVYNPPSTTCFPLNSSTPVQVIANDQCGNLASNTFTVTILPGPTCGSTNCISIHATNIVAYTCSSCTTVPFNVTAVDPCCSSGVTLAYNISTNTCFPLNTTTPVQVLAYDNCGNIATNFFTVTVLPDPNCVPTNCITIFATNIVAYTCNPCTEVPFNVSAVDICCASAGVSLTYSVPTNMCFQTNTVTPVEITGFDACGHAATNTITVTVLPGPNCGPTNCINIYATNIVAYTCNPCTEVPFNVSAVDFCCASSGVSLTYSDPTNTCFLTNTVTSVQITGFDSCGHAATNTITVTVLPDPNCGPTNCINIYATNIVVYTCSNCVKVPFNVTAVDTCCPAGGVTLTYTPSTNFCFPLNMVTPVEIKGYDGCGNGATNFITVTVLPGPNCGGSRPGPTIIGPSGAAGGFPAPYFAIWWNGSTGQLQQSTDLLHWVNVPGGSNSPFVAPAWMRMGFYRLQYQVP